MKKMYVILFTSVGKWERGEHVSDLEFANHGVTDIERLVRIGAIGSVEVHEPGAVAEPGSSIDSYSYDQLKRVAAGYGIEADNLPKSKEGAIKVIEIAKARLVAEQKAKLEAEKPKPAVNIQPEELKGGRMGGIMEVKPDAPLDAVVVDTSLPDAKDTQPPAEDD